MIFVLSTSFQSFIYTKNLFYKCNKMNHFESLVDVQLGDLMTDVLLYIMINHFSAVRDEAVCTILSNLHLFAKISKTMLSKFVLE